MDYQKSFKVKLIMLIGERITKFLIANRQPVSRCSYAEVTTSFSDLYQLHEIKV